MSDGLPPISMEITQDGAPYVIVDDQRASDPDALMALVPDLSDPFWLRARAQYINHLAAGYDHEVIFDPEAFEKAYMERYRSEDPTEYTAPGVMRLTHYGIPPFEAIHPPAMEGTTLVFYTRQTIMGLPYRVTVPEGGAPSYTPMGLLQESPPPDPAVEISPDGDTLTQPAPPRKPPGMD